MRYGDHCWRNESSKPNTFAVIRSRTHKFSLHDFYKMYWIGFLAFSVTFLCCKKPHAPCGISKVIRCFETRYNNIYQTWNNQNRFIEMDILLLGVKNCWSKVADPCRPLQQSVLASFDSNTGSFSSCLEPASQDLGYRLREHGCTEVSLSPPPHPCFFLQSCITSVSHRNVTTPPPPPPSEAL